MEFQERLVAATGAGDPETGAVETPANGQPEAEPMRKPGEMPLTDHLEELRWRIIKSAGALAAGFGVCFALHQQIITLLLAPAHRAAIVHGNLVFTAPAEYFVAALKVSFFAGLFLSLPVLLYQVMAFVAPGLTNRERRWVVPMSVAAAVLFAAGAAFSYLALLPIGFKFLVGFAPQDVVQPMLSIGEVLSFSTLFLFATGGVFQLPLVLLAMSLVGIVSSGQLARFRRMAIVLAFLAGALLSPSPDVFSQGLLAAALLGLYEISIVLMKVARR
ncbi:MAG: twin-arginine translocase subunit TatC [Candidatus Sericytochromatia bacterium]|nr:twin-arginine translocase subunit TatC [Candidatus Tanganyikabacteria bacterium]